MHIAVGAIGLVCYTSEIGLARPVGNVIME